MSDVEVRLPVSQHIDGAKLETELSVSAAKSLPPDKKVVKTLFIKDLRYLTLS